MVYVHLILLFCPAVLSSIPIVRERCKPKYHFWRPFYGEFPTDKFVASTDPEQRHVYIAKVIPIDDYRAYTVPAHLDKDHVLFQWEQSGDSPIYVSKFMEVMCTKLSDRHVFRWKKVTSDDDTVIIKDKCCLVEGGIANWKERIIVSYIGRAFRNSSYYIGPAYIDEDWHFKKGVHVMRLGQAKHIKTDYELLAYNCIDDESENYRRRYG